MVRGVTLLQAEVRRRIAQQYWKELKVVTAVTARGINRLSII